MALVALTSGIAAAGSAIHTLVETGWDPGFVNFRLAIMARVLGDFERAKAYADRAANPIIRDVWSQLDRQIELIDNRDSSFTKEDIA